MSNTSILGSFGGQAGDALMFRNRIINGGMDVWQRGTSFNPTGAYPVAYTADRWQIYGDIASGGNLAVNRIALPLGQTETPTDYALEAWAQSFGTGGGQTFLVQQKIEGVRSFAGQQVTLSFYAASSSPLSNLQVLAVQSFGTGGSPSSAVQTIVTSALSIPSSTYTRYSFTFTVPSISGKTLGSNNDDFLAIQFVVPASNGTNRLRLTGVQLESGATATPFERRPIGVETQLCMRYYINAPISSFIFPLANQYQSVQFPVPMRSLPVVNVTVNSGTVSDLGRTAFGFRAFNTLGPQDAGYTASAEL